MKRFLLFALLLSPVMFSCQKEEIIIDPDNLLLGLWNYVDYKGDTAIYARQKTFGDIQGYKFNADGTLVERKNSGWCGTPPVSYADFAGSWTILNDTLIQINAGYWGGTMNYKMDVECVNEDLLKVRMIYDSK